MRTLLGASFLFLLPVAAQCQTPAFDIADVHVSPRADWVKTPAKLMQGGFAIGDRYELHRATMLDLIRTAYNVDAERVYGGPSWLDYDRYEIAAKTKPGTRPEALRAMLQTLLQDRFQLKVKMDTRDVDGYVLTKGKGEPKARAAAAGAPTAGCQTMRPTLDGPVRYSDIQCRNVTMDQFGQTLRRMVSGPLGNLPVKDATGLEGGFDIDFQYVTQPMTASGPANAGVLEAVEKMGLKLAPGKVPQQVLAVESVNEQPTADPPGAAAALPPLPAPQFEVAAIEWPCHDNMSIGLRFEPGGRVTATCEALGSLIRQAWGLAPFQQPEGVTKVFGPSGRKYDISIAAKAPEGVALDPQHSQQARDILNAMLRSLLIDRYKMAVHYEDRPVDAYTLVASKPKLTKADPANRTGCKQQGQQQQAAQNVKLVCRNMTMQQFAEQIQAYDSDIYYPVQDGTGIEGAWDFTIDYNPMAGLIARLSGVRINGTAAASEGEASEPNGSISFAESLGKIGLKLETHKRPEPVLVIDHIAEKPTEN